MESAMARTAIGVLLLFVLWARPVYAELENMDIRKCSNILGMENGRIPDSDLTASSSHDSNMVGAHRARLKHDAYGGAWCPRGVISNISREYLEINLHTVHSLTAIQTQGRYGSGVGQEYTENYSLEYWRPGFKNRWALWKNFAGHALLQGNMNTMDIVEQRLEPFLLAEKLRIYPYSLYNRSTCMRLELIGCVWKTGLVSYTIPQGVSRGRDINLTDKTYDGLHENGMLYGGLGQLTDGMRGQDRYRDDYSLGKDSSTTVNLLEEISEDEYENSTEPPIPNLGYEWVGWRNDTVGDTGHHIEMLFEFAQVRSFSAMRIYASNKFSKDVQVFKHAKVFFSKGGKQFIGEPVIYAYMPDGQIENAREVVVKLHNRVGKYLRVHLYFAKSWIMISEVTFDSRIAVGNHTDEAYEVVQHAGKNGGKLSGTRPWGDPFLRDEVLTTQKVLIGELEDDQNDKKSLNTIGSKGVEETPVGSTSEYAVVGVLSLVALLLLAAIIFVSARNRSVNTALTTRNVVLPEDEARDLAITRLDEEDKEEVTYHEPYQVTRYQPPTPPRIVQQYGNVAQVTVHEYEFTPTAAIRHPEPERPPPPPFLLPLPDIGLPGVQGHIYDSPIFPQRHKNIHDQYYDTVKVPNTAPPTVPVITSHTIKNLEGNPRHKSLRFSREISEMARIESENMEVPNFFWRNLKILHPIGDGQFGTIYMCEVIGIPPYNNCVSGDLVAVQTLRVDSTSVAIRNFDQHIKRLSRLTNLNVGKVIGCCRDEDKPLSLVLEQLYAGDLNEFLQNRVPDLTTRTTKTAKSLSFGYLIHIAAQIASGMKYLEGQKFVHKDLATRNCLVGNSYVVKIASTGIGKLRYPQDYYVIERKSGSPTPMPIRWLAWESSHQDKFTSRSDSWAFGVTLWEILTFGRIQPYEEMSNMMVVDNLKQLCHSNVEQIMLSRPRNCPEDLYELMSDCWKKSELARPCFRELHEFLMAKNMGFRPH